MTKQKTKILAYRISLIGIGVLLIGSIALAANVSFLDKVAQFTGQILAGQLFQDVKDQLAQEESDNLGSITGPISPYNYFVFGGVEHYYGNMEMKTGTTTVCRIQAPAATSTLIFASASFQTATAAAVAINLAKTATSTSYATTTSLGDDYVLAANTSVTIVASSTDSKYATATTFGPKEWFVVKMDNGGWAGANAPKGECNAEWIVVDN